LVDEVLQKYVMDAWVTKCLHKYMEESFHKDMDVVRRESIDYSRQF
jgi:BMFP domain-containing protein YqiC